MQNAPETFGPGAQVTTVDVDQLATDPGSISPLGRPALPSPATDGPR